MDISLLFIVTVTAIFGLSCLSMYLIHKEKMAKMQLEMMEFELELKKQQADDIKNVLEVKEERQHVLLPKGV